MKNTKTIEDRKADANNSRLNPGAKFNGAHFILTLQYHQSREQVVTIFQGS